MSTVAETEVVVNGVICQQHVPVNVLVTGGCGFIGSNFINSVFDAWPFATFVNVDKLAVGASPGNVEARIRASDRYTFVKANLLDQASTERILKEYSIDTVIHFAAQTHVDESYADREGCIKENVIGITRLLEAINAYRRDGDGAGEMVFKRLVHISTDEIYGDSRDEGIKSEHSLPEPTNPYAASKAACEMIIRCYWHSYRLPYVTVRMNNVYGPYQDYSKLVPKFARQALEGQPFTLMGDGTQTRSWMFAADCTEAIRRVTERGRLGETYNIGTELEVSIVDLASAIQALVAKLTGRDEKAMGPLRFEYIADRPYQDQCYYIDFSKIREELGWRCTTPFNVGLERTIAFYVQHYKAEEKGRKSPEAAGDSMGVAELAVENGH